MLAEEYEVSESVADAMYEKTSDLKIWQQCLVQSMREAEERHTKEKLDELTKQLAEKNMQIAKLKEENAILKQNSGNASLHSATS